MSVERTFDLLDRYKESPVKEDALCSKENGVWVKYSSTDYINYSYNFSYGLLEMGLKKGDKIMTVSNNRPEWNFVDLGMAMIGVIHVPVFASLSASDYQYIINHCEAKMIIVSDKKLFNNISHELSSIGNAIRVFSFDDINGVKSWKEIIETGKLNAEKHIQTVESIKNSVQPDDFASLIYTSGTTGRAKGVILTHRNMVSNFLSAASVFNLKSEDKYLSILPLCHVGGRMGNYQTQYSRSSIYYAENMGTIALNMAEIKPDGFDAVQGFLRNSMMS